MIVITGPTGSVKTTTLATILSILNEPIRKILTVEEHSVVGGLGTIVAETVGRAGLSVTLAQVALPDQDLEVGVPAELYEYYGLTVSNVAARARKLARG